MKRILISLISALLIFSVCAGMPESAFAAGTAPVAENLELTTFRNTSVGGRLSAYDPDSDKVGFEITTQPVKGSIRLEDDGCFVYTPDENKKGKDYFGYKAKDEQGNISQEATVIIRIEKQNKAVEYIDMEGRAGAYAAAVLSQADIYTGEKLGMNYCFRPDASVSKGEFLSMCISVSQKRLINGVMSTGYEDDESIPGWMKEYVATAAMSGSGREAMFNADREITKSEALLMLNDLLGIENADHIGVDCEGEDPQLLQAFANLSAVGIADCEALSDELLTREDAAVLLVNAINALK